MKQLMTHRHKWARKSYTLKGCGFYNFIGNRFFWEKDFPPVFAHTSVAYIRQHINFSSSKEGNLGLAIDLIRTCVKSERIDMLKQLYPKAVLLPIKSKNMLPLALALQIGLPIYHGVELISDKHRKKMTAMQRLTHAPCFCGKVFKDQEYILVDDVVTQGGTLSAMRRYILSKGGKVVAVTALASAAGSGILALEDANLQKLFEKFDVMLAGFLRDYSIAEAPEQLTNSQARYLLRFSSVEHMRKSAQNIYPCPVLDTDKC